MKVVCVSDREIAPYPGAIYPNGPLVIGETYTVTGMFKSGDGIECYELAEKPVLFADLEPDEWTGWESHQFVPIDYYAAEFAVKESEPQTAEQTVCS